MDLQFQLTEDAEDARFEAMHDEGALRVQQCKFPEDLVEERDVGNGLILLLHRMSDPLRPACVGFVIQDLDALMYCVEQRTGKQIAWSQHQKGDRAVLAELLKTGIDNVSSEVARQGCAIAQRIATEYTEPFTLISSTSMYPSAQYLEGR